MSKLKPTMTIDEPTSCGTLHVIIEHDNYKPTAIRCHLGKIGTCTKVFMDSMTLLMTRSLEQGMTLDDIIACVNNHHCHNPKFVNGKKTYSCADAISKALREFKKEVIEKSNDS